MIRWTALPGLTVLWLLLWGDVTPLLVVGGLLVSLLAVAAFPFPQGRWDGRFRPWSFVVLIACFAVDLVVSSVQVSWIAVRPKPLGRSAVVRVQLRTESELVMALTGELVSLVPGSLLLELDAATSTVWLHELDGERDLSRVVDRVLAQERRVIAAIGTREEYEAHVVGVKEARS
jgi:multicomponent Na+:H+ antiporter subunit E